MQIKQIETFYWAARLGSFVKAARHLNATTSAVSMRIQELESRLGVPLFDRAHKRAQLTSQGLHLLPLAEQFLTTADKIFKNVSTTAQLEGYVRLGVAEVVALTYLPTFLTEFRNQFARIQLEIEVALSHVLEDKLYSGKLDIALAPCQLSPSRYSHTSLCSENFQWMCSRNLTAVPEVVTPPEFMNLPLIVTSRERLLRGSILQWINENHITFCNPTICNTFTIAGRMAIAGFGCAFLPMRIYGENVRRRQLRVIDCRPKIGPLEHFVVRPLGEPSPVLDAVEHVAVTVARKAAPRVE